MTLRLPRHLVAALSAIALVLAGAGAARAADGPALTINGEPTGAEIATIQREWSFFTELFSEMSCLDDLEVTVVDRVEDHYDGAPAGPIAAFYRLPPASVVFIEHGKVRTDHLVHEFAHHLDASCGLGDGGFAASFRQAQSLPADRPWTSGPAWGSVPAEHFAQTVLAVMDVTSGKIAISADAEQLVRSLTIGRPPSFLRSIESEAVTPPAPPPSPLRIR